MTVAEVDQLFMLIADSNELSLEEKAVADFALLAVLEGGRPSVGGLSCLRAPLGHDFVEAVLAKHAEE